MILISILMIFGFIFYLVYPGERLPKDAMVDKIEVFKEQRKMKIYFDGKLLKTYQVALGQMPVGTKRFEGDLKTPEGKYFIDAKNANSRFHKNLGISYPNVDDIKFAEKLGKSAGGDIKIHGLRNGRGLIGNFHRWKNWTHGCVALTNAEIDELYESVAIGTPIYIYR